MLFLTLMFQESESAEEESIPGSERGSIDRGHAPQAMAEGKGLPLYIDIVLRYLYGKICGWMWKVVCIINLPLESHH